MSDMVLELTDNTNKPLFRISSINDDSSAGFKRSDTFSVILIQEGEGTVIADFSEYSFAPNCLVCFSLYQAFSFKSEGKLSGVMISFHPDFFCLHQHRNEVSCNGILFNNVYESPVTPLTASDRRSIESLAEGIISELKDPGMAQAEVLLSYLKILLINASRIKIAAHDNEGVLPATEPLILGQLKDALEQNFQSLHRPGDYAGLLNTTVTVLNNISKRHFNKKLTDLITERIITAAKRELYLTAKPVKLVAREMGFNDEFYFSRHFKKHAGVSPLVFRNTAGFNKGGA